MDASRRELLRLGGLASLSSLAGCSMLGLGSSGGGGGGESTSTSTRTRTSTPASTSTATPEPTTAQSPTAEPTRTPTETPRPGPGDTPSEDAADLAARTESTLSELEWFTAEYDPTIRSYLSTLQRTRATIRLVLESATIDASDLRRLRSVSASVASFVRENLQPHFQVEDASVRTNNTYLNRVRQLADRGDQDQARVALREMLKFYQYIGSEAYLDTDLSDDPIHNRLFGRLRAGETPDYLELDGTEEALFGARYVSLANDESYYVYDRQTTIAGIPVSAAEVTSNDSHFDSVLEPRNRTAKVYVSAHWRPRRLFTPDPDRLPTQPILIQRYRSASAARATVGRLLDGPVGQDGLERLGPRSWRRVFYLNDHYETYGDLDGPDITYAYLRRAGQYVFATAPGRVPWDERTGRSWNPLRLSWLWD